MSLALLTPATAVSSLLVAAAFLFRAPAPAAAAFIGNQASREGRPTCDSTPLKMSSTSTSQQERDEMPELVVFDLDACFWDQEMYEMPSLPDREVRGELPNERGAGVTGVMSGPNEIKIHRGSMLAMQRHADGDFPNTKVCFASSADTPLAERIGRAALKKLEVLPGLTVWDLVVGRDWDGVDVNQIGRQPPLSSNKAKSHFPRIRELTGIRYDRMLFFDDCNWGDHCGMVARECKEPDTQQGPAVVRTPYGLTEQKWEEGLKAYAQQAARLKERQRN